VSTASGSTPSVSPTSRTPSRARTSAASSLTALSRRTRKKASAAAGHACAPAQRAYGHRKGAGKRKGAQGARTPSKQAWIQKIRAIRKALVALREEKTIDAHLYRVLYRKAAGGQFRSVAHMKAQMEIIAGRMK